MSVHLQVLHLAAQPRSLLPREFKLLLQGLHIRCTFTPTMLMHACVECTYLQCSCMHGSAALAQAS